MLPANRKVYQVSIFRNRGASSPFTFDLFGTAAVGAHPVSITAVLLCRFLATHGTLVRSCSSHIVLHQLASEPSTTGSRYTWPMPCSWPSCCAGQFAVQQPVTKLQALHVAKATRDVVAYHQSLSFDVLQPFHEAHRAVRCVSDRDRRCSRPAFIPPDAQQCQKRLYSRTGQPRTLVMPLWATATGARTARAETYNASTATGPDVRTTLAGENGSDSERSAVSHATWHP